MPNKTLHLNLKKSKSFVDKLYPEFTGCDGKLWSDEFLEINMHNAAEREDFKYAAKCRDELKRRQRKEKNN